MKEKFIFGYGSQYGANIANANTYAMNYSVPNTWVYGEPNIVEKDKIKNVIAVTYMGKMQNNITGFTVTIKWLLKIKQQRQTKWSSDTLDIEERLAEIIQITHMQILSYIAYKFITEH